MSNGNHNIAILFFAPGTAPSYYIGAIGAGRIVEECAARLAYDMTITAQVFAEDGTQVARARIKEGDAQWVPVNNARMSPDTQRLYSELSDMHSVFRAAHRQCCDRYAAFRNRARS